MVVIWIKYILVSSKDWVWGNRCSATCYFVQNTWLSRHDIAIVKNADAIMSHEKTDGKINYFLYGVDIISVCHEQQNMAKT